MSIFEMIPFFLLFVIITFIIFMRSSSGRNDNKKEEKKESVCYIFHLDQSEYFCKTYITITSTLSDSFMYYITPREQLMKELKSGFITDVDNGIIYPTSRLLRITVENMEVKA